MFLNSVQIQEREERVNLFDGQEALSILHISDVHLWFSTKILFELATLIAAKPIDLVVLTGDYYDLPQAAYHFRDFLIRVAATHKVVFIRGNHDVLFGRKISNLLSDIPNCHCVEHAVYRHRSKNGKTFNITSWKNKHQLMDRENEKNIVLIHNPEKIKEQELHNMHLILAGHLHGGQFIFFTTKNGANFPGCLLYKHCSDRKQLNSSTLIVSKGLGDTFPFRFNCPKEIVRIVIN